MNNTSYAYKKSPLLARLAPEAAKYFGLVVDAVLRDDLHGAADEIYRLAEVDIPDELAEEYLMLAQNICAAAEDAEGFIVFKKIWIAFLIEQERLGEAAILIAEYIEVLQEDEEILELGKALFEQMGSNDDRTIM